MYRTGLTQGQLDQWVCALRSGDFRQGQYRLYEFHNNTYCCLGVLGELSGLLDGRGGVSGSLDHQPCTYLPLELGLSMDVQRILSANNDLRRFDFDEIATWIEHNLEPAE